MTAREQQPWTRPVPRSARWHDALLAAGLVTASVAVDPAAHSGFAAGSLAWSFALGAPLAVRRSWPIPAGAVTTVAFIGMGIAGFGDRMVGQVAVGIALFSIGAWTTHRGHARVSLTALTGLLLISAIAGLVFDLDAVEEANRGLPTLVIVILTIAGNVVALAALLAFGETSWRAAHRLAQVEARTQELAAEQQRSERAALALERMKIARELHDVVAHHISIVSLHAGAARLAAGRNAAVSPALAKVEESARDAVADLKGLLFTLRDENSPPELTPTAPGLAALPALFTDFSSADHGPVLQVEGTPRPLRPTVETTLVRVAQEAATNIRKHAGENARVAATLTYGTSQVELVVENTLARVTPVTGDAGLGLIGMRERAAAVSGRLFTGADAAGYRVADGFTVRLVVPA